MYFLMFYLRDETLISSTISSVVTHLTLKHSPRISSYLTVPTVLASRLPTGGREVADRVEEVVFVCVVLCKCLHWKSDVCVFVQDKFFSCVCECVCACVNVCDRCEFLCQGWGHTLPPHSRCLQRFISTQQVIGWTPFTPTYTHADVYQHTQHAKPPGYH